MAGAGSLPGRAAGVPPGPAGGVIRVLVAEDMRILRDTIVAVLNLEDDIEVVAAVTDGQAIVPAVIGQRPDVAVVDIDLPGTDGLTAAARLHQQCPDCRVLILTVLGSPGNLRRACPRMWPGSWSRTPRPPIWPMRSARSLRAGG